MNKPESLEFARFIIEEKPDYSESDIALKDDAKIEFDKNRQINAMYVPIRLMTNFKTYSTIFTDAQEQEAK